jgi:hypothetical protein
MRSKLFYKTLLILKKIHFPRTVRPGFLGKTIITLVWVVPAIALTAFISDKVVRQLHPPPPLKPEMVKVPIEVIQADEKSKVVYVELETHAVPEPSSMLLVPLSALVLLRRRR